jgi:hypothetical protein
MSVTSSPQAQAQAQAETSSEHENVHVIVRVRPFNSREVELHNQDIEKKPEYDRMPIRSVVEFDGQTCICLDTQTWQEKERFAFDQCYWSIPDDIQSCPNSPFAGQSALYEGFGKTMLTQAYKGYNTCFFAYGQTGAGKTYSMMGNPDSDDPGLIPRVCQQLFRDVEQMAGEAAVHRDQYVMSFRVEVRYMEIYNEHVSDLLWTLTQCPPEVKAKMNPENMKVRSSPATGVFIEHLTSVEVTNWEDMLRLINIGNSCRHTAATKMNERSSRSHAIFKVTLTQITTSVPKKQFEKPSEHLREAVINLIDLAGCERNKKTGATGDRLKEAASINKSLSCLKGVIDVLVENSTKGTKKRPPYRDSTLTSLLMDSLGGNSKTFMLVCISPHSDNAEETIQTLRYGSRARQIVHTVHVNENATGRMLLELEDELEKMKRELERAQNSAQPETIERLKVQIEEQEAQVTAYESQIDEHTERIARMREAKEKELRARETMALGNLKELVRSRGNREEARSEYVKLRDRLQLLRTDKEALEHQLTEAERKQDSLREAAEANKQRAAELEQDSESWRKKVSKLDMYRRELEENVADQQAQLEKLRMSKHGAILRARYRCAQIRLETKSEIAELEAKHQGQLSSIRRDAEAERGRIIRTEKDKEVALDDENRALKAELDSVLSETLRLEGERGSQVAQLEEELRALQAENRRKMQENHERFEAAKVEWVESYNRMAREMRQEHDNAERQWSTRYEDAAARERVAMEENVARWERELTAATTHWGGEVQRAEKDCREQVTAVTGAWEAKIQACMDQNSVLRRELRIIEAKEREYAIMQRRVSAVMEACPKPSETNSDEYRSLYTLLQDFQAEYDQNAPAMYRIHHLLREEFLQTRCDLAPLVGVAEDAQPARRRDPPADSIPTDEKPALRLRPRSPRRTA